LFFPAIISAGKNREGNVMSKSENGNTIQLHRVLRAPVEKVYRAFLDSAAKCRWLPPYGFLGHIQENDVRVGGTYRMSFTNFGTGQSHSFSGTYTELTPGRVIRYSDKFDSPDLPGEMQITVNLKEVTCGTELSIVQENVPPQIPPEMCYLGWQESLLQLANLVESNIP
jgi:uncharacterized protein YndB with AHSA1/START domain